MTKNWIKKVIKRHLLYRCYATLLKRVMVSLKILNEMNAYLRNPNIFWIFFTLSAFNSIFNKTFQRQKNISCVKTQLHKFVIVKLISCFFVLSCFLSFRSWKNFFSKAGKSSLVISANKNVLQTFTTFGDTELEPYKITQERIYNTFNIFLALSSKT